MPTHKAAKIRALFLLVLVLGPLVVWGSQAKEEPGKSGINIAIDVSQVLDKIEKWVTNGFSSWQENKRDLARNAIPNLVVDYLQLAALMEQLADNLGTKRTAQREKEFASLLLTRQLDQLEVLMEKITNTAEGIDRAWVLANLELADRRVVTYSGRNSLVAETLFAFRIKHIAGELTQAEIFSIAARLRKAAIETRRLAKDLAITVTK